MDITDPLLYAGPNWNPVVAYYAPACLGDGRDGVKLFTTNTTLTADIRASLIVVYPGVVLTTAGFELVSQDLILNTGTVSADGGNAVGAVQGAGAAGSATGTAGVGGGPGGARTGAGAATQSARGSTTTAEAKIPAGGAGGSGGGAGGTNNAITLDTAIRSPLMGPNPTYIFGDYMDPATVTPYILTCGPGGGGGNAAVGGTGGGGGGINRLRARRIINLGIVSARGGNGSDATGVNGSGGGGGSGGRNIAVGYRFGQGLWLVNGGTGGAKDGTGTAGSAGGNGFNHFFE